VGGLPLAGLNRRLRHGVGGGGIAADVQWGYRCRGRAMVRAGWEIFDFAGKRL